MPAPALHDFTGRVALVTGAARGLGRAVADRLHESGGSVVVNIRLTTRFEAITADEWRSAIEVNLTMPFLQRWRPHDVGVA